MAQLLEVTTPDIFGLGGPYKVIRLAVLDNSVVEAGDIIAELDSSDATVQIETHESGKVEFAVALDQVLVPNQLIANILSSEPPNGYSLRVNLPARHLSIVDRQRGRRSRHDYLLALIDEHDDKTIGEPDIDPNA